MSQSDPVIRQIDGDDYTFYFLSPRVSMRLLLRISKACAPSLGIALDALIKMRGANTETRDALMFDGTFHKAVSELVERLDTETLDGIIDTLAPFSEHSKRRLDAAYFDEHFRGKIGRLSRWLVAALDVQYHDFWKGLVGGFTRNA